MIVTEVDAMFQHPEKLELNDEEMGFAAMLAMQCPTEPEKARRCLKYAYFIVATASSSALPISEAIEKLF